jgi:hypothetical protein
MLRAVRRECEGEELVLASEFVAGKPEDVVRILVPLIHRRGRSEGEHCPTARVSERLDRRVGMV